MTAVKLYKKGGNNTVSVSSNRGTLQLAGYYNNVREMQYRGKCPLVVCELTDRPTMVRVYPPRNVDSKGVADWRIKVEKYPREGYPSNKPVEGGNIAIYDYAEFGEQSNESVALRLYNKKGLAVFDSRKRPLEVIDFIWKYLGVTEEWTWAGQPVPELPEGKLGVVYTGIPLEGDRSRGWTRVGYFRYNSLKLGARAIGATVDYFSKRSIQSLKNALLVRY